VAIGLLRQQLPASVRVHGLVTNGGQAPNALPELTEGRASTDMGNVSQVVPAIHLARRAMRSGALPAGLARLAQRSRSHTSNASLRASPTKLKATTVRTMATPAGYISHQSPS
jgi:metal-dependent amidase/aminoacylase/carboxypeptidase family protein